MKTQKNNYTQLIGSVILTILFTIPVNAAASDAYKDENIRINPEFKINRSSNGDVVVTNKNPESTAFRHEFKDFHADLLMATYRKQGMGHTIETLSKKYYLSKEECRREIKHAINILAEWNIVLRDNEIAQKK